MKRVYSIVADTEYTCETQLKLLAASQHMLQPSLPKHSFNCLTTYNRHRHARTAASTTVG